MMIKISMDPKVSYFPVVISHFFVKYFIKTKNSIFYDKNRILSFSMLR